ncbi:bacterioferritin [Thiohalophilus sp.]|uniref:ferritin-like domain-containing protein n=1 Tax=Thiohalophilus sp. TaxID=3028392 RepID=UPI0039760E53
MLYANADLRVLGYLGRALSLELSAVQLYSTQARLVATWGLTGVSKRFSNEASEEMAHADRIIGRMLALGVAPNASQLRPPRLGHSLQELLQHNHAFESELIRLYAEATQHCARSGDHDNRLFFEELLAEEQDHAAELVKWLKELEQPGATVNKNRATF